jgi:hypothetical protein
VDPRAGLDDAEKRKFLTLPRLELRVSSVLNPKPVDIPTTLPRLPYPEINNDNDDDFYKMSPDVTLVYGVEMEASRSIRNVMSHTGV